VAALALGFVSLLAVLGAPGVNAEDREAPERLLLAQAADEPPEREPAASDEATTPAQPAEPDPAAAEPPPGESEAQSGIEVLNVRGRGASAIEADVPSSITQFDASTIEALGAQDISDLSRVTPNVNIVQPGATQATFFVRGVGLSDFSSNAAGAVTIFQDDVSLNAPAIQTGQLYDVEGVDVVKGPQGAGPFRNASAGAIRVRSRRPTGNYGANLRSSIGWYDAKGEGDKGAREALIQDYEGALEVPIVAESLSSRFAFRLREAEPYRNNGCFYALPFDKRLVRSGRIPNPNPPPAMITVGVPLSTPGVIQCGEQSFAAIPPAAKSTIPFGLPKAVNDEHNWAARGTLRFQPPDTELELFLNAHGSRLDQDSTLGQTIGTNPLQDGVTTPRFGGRDGNGYVDRDVAGEFSALCQTRDPVFQGACTNLRAQQQLAKNLAEDRPLDAQPYRGDYNRVGQTTRDTWGGFISGEAELFADMKLFGLASYDEYDRFQDVDTDFTPEPQFELIQSDDAWQTYEELRLDGELEAEPVEWSLGGYYMREQLDNDTTAAVGVLPPDVFEIRRIYSQTIDSFAAWGEFAWDFADEFTLEGGVRWNWERKKFDFREISGQSDASAHDSETWQTPTGQIMLTYHIDQDKAAYARYTRGFKAGHFNALASQTFTGLDISPADEEYNDAWEAGLRGGWLDRRLSLAGAFFYYRYENYQIFLFTDSAEVTQPPVLEIVNAKKAENFGVEIEGVLQPLRGWAPRLLDGLRLSANFSWLHGEYIDFTTFRNVALVGLPAPTASIPVDYSGKRLQNAPQYKASGTAEWTFDLGRFGYLIPRYDVNWSDDVFFDPNEGRGSLDPTGTDLLPEYAIGQKAYFLHNVRLAYRTPSGNVELAGWIRNVEDQVYKNFAFDVSRFNNLVINFPGEPRTIGFDLSFTF
jgi:outer membrane receptor protein involved in Fe transport